MSTRSTALVIQQAITSVIPRPVPSKSCPVNSTYCRVSMRATLNEPVIKSLNLWINKPVYLNRTHRALIWLNRWKINKISLEHNWYSQSTAGLHVSAELTNPSSGLLRETNSKEMQWHIDMVKCWHGDMSTCQHVKIILTYWHGEMLTWWHVTIMLAYWHGDMSSCQHVTIIWHIDMVTCHRVSMSK